jgi:hypothetical protein
MSSLGGPNIVTDGLIVYLDAANTKSYLSGSNTWYDRSGYGVNGTQSGLNFPVYNSTNGGNLIFNNTPVNLGNSSILNLTNLTLSVWYKTVNGTNQIAIGKSHTTSYYLNLAPSANSFSLWTAGHSLGATVYTLGDGNWHNISATMVGTTKTLYYDGIQVATGAGTVPTTDIYNLVVGNSGNSSAPFYGSMGNVLVYNKALTTHEVLQNYNATKSRFNL